MAALADGGDVHVGVDEDVVVGISGLDFLVEFLEDGLEVVAEAHDDDARPRVRRTVSAEQIAQRGAAWDLRGRRAISSDEVVTGPQQSWQPGTHSNEGICCLRKRIL